MTDYTEYLVLVPKPGTPAGRRIDPGSGVVAAADGDPLLVYFEGNRYGADNLRQFKERVMSAAGRLHAHYPTIAFGQYPRADFDVVGTFSFSSDWQDTQVGVTNATVLAEQLGQVFQLTNHIDTDWTLNAQVMPRVPRARSTSVGDVVVDEAEVAWLCEMVGWSRLEVEHG